MIQQGQPLQFVSSGDETKFPFVQLDVAVSGQENGPPPGIPVIRLDGGPFIKKVQIRVGGNPARIPKVRIPHLAAWFKYGVGITSAANAVSQWDDQSGNGRHLLQASGTNQPALQADGSILFDGVDNFMACDPFTLNQPYSIYGLVNQKTWTLNDSLWDGNTSTTGRVFQQAVTPSLRFNAGASLTNVAGLTLDTYGVVWVVGNSTSSAIGINNVAPTTGDGGTTNMAGFYLGATGGAASGFCHMQCKEVLIFSAAHDALTRASIIRYLASVGGLSI